MRKGALRQPRLKRGRRMRGSGAFTPEMKRWIQDQMRRFNCGESWVLAVAISTVSGLPCVRPEELAANKARIRRKTK